MRKLHDKLVANLASIIEWALGISAAGSYIAILFLVGFGIDYLSQSYYIHGLVLLAGAVGLYFISAAIFQLAELIEKGRDAAYVQQSPAVAAAENTDRQAVLNTL